MHALISKNEKDTIAHDAICRAMENAGDYWNDRFNQSQNLHILQGMFVLEIIDHYEQVAAHEVDTTDEIEELAATLAMKEGFLDDETSFTEFTRALFLARVHIPEFQIIRYKGGGFNCSSLR